jgi:hypothetical protein
MIDSRIVRGILVGVGATALLAGCGPQSQAGQPAPTTVTETVSDGPAEEPAEPAEDAKPATGDPVPCSVDVVEPEMAAGESQPQVWNSAVTLTNVGTEVCRLEGGADLTFIAPSGDPYDLPVEDGEPGDDLVLVGPGEQASLLFSYPSAPEGPASEECSSPDSALVTLPGDEQPLEVWHPESFEEMPMLCGGPVSVSGWSPGGF